MVFVKIAIRADGGKSIGMGHIMRTLVLAGELKNDNQVFYVCKIEKSYINNSENISESKYIKGIEKIIENGFEVKLINEDNILTELQAIKADILITDSYEVNEKYFDFTKNFFNKTIYIDDTNKHYFDVDYIINQNLGAEAFKYKVPEHTKLLLGKNFVMLREEFREARPIAISEIIKNVMITVGGSDPFNVTPLVLNYVKELNYNFHVVVGPSFTNKQAIKAFEKENIILHENTDMLKLMKKCDMAIAGCGSTLYELARLGIPTIGIVIADNQEKLGALLSERGVIKCLGWYNKLEESTFCSLIKDLAENQPLRKNMSEKALKLVDGKGVSRIIEQITIK